MRNLHKLLIILISVVFITSGVLAQADVSPKLNDQTQQKVKPEKPYKSFQVMDFTESAPAQAQGNSAVMVKDPSIETTNPPVKLKKGKPIPSSKEVETVYPMSVDYWTGTTDGTSYTETSLVKGYGLTSDGYMIFDVSTIPAGAVVNSVVFNGYVYETNYPYWSVTPCNMDPLTTSAADLRTHIGTFNTSALAYYYGNESSTYAPGWKVHDLTGTAVADLQAALSQGWFAVGILERDGTDTYFLSFEGWNETNMPYLEVDYFVPEFGVLNGTVTELASGNPMAGVMVTATGPYETYSMATMSDGTYEFDPVQVGDYMMTVEMAGYNVMMADVTIIVGQTTTEDFAMTSPTMDIDPLAINVTIDPESQLTENIEISNNGDGELHWSAQLELLTDGTDETWDLQFSFDVNAATGAAGNAGAECDGTNYYTTRWASNLIHKYDLEGNMVLEFSVPGVTGLRDLAFDGTYFYGGAAATTIFEMDFASQTLVSSISSPQQVRTIAYDDGEDAFWVSNFGTDITLVSKAGAQVAVITDALLGKYGSAYDNWTENGPFLWVFDQGGGAGAAQLIHQYDLNTLAATGFSYDVLNDLGPNASAIAGGLFTIPNVYPGTVSLGGLLQGTPDVLFMYELAISGPQWISIDPNSGDVDPGSFSLMDVNFDATGIPAGTVKTANIHFTSDPDVGMVTVPVSMSVGDQEFGFIEGNVMLTGSAPYNYEDVENVMVVAGAYSDYPDASGNYQIQAYPGTYDVVATLYGYEEQMEVGVVVTAGSTVSNIDFVMPTTIGRFMGTVTDIDSGDPIENATVTIVDTDFEMMTAADGTYEFFVEAGTYDVMATHPTYTTGLAQDLELIAETDVTQDFELEYACDYCDATTSNQDEWIIDVICGDINNLGTPWQGGIADYTDQSTIIFPGLSEDITVNNGNAWASDIVYVWVDWNANCEFEQGGNEEFQLENVGGTGATFTGQITAPVSAVEGVYRMRVRMTYSTAPVPCGVSTYGEVEEYSIFVPPGTYGELEGFVTDLGSGDPIEGAEINVANLYMTTSGSDGYYYFEEVFTGTWDVYCTAVGYNDEMETVTIVEGDLTVQDFEMSAPEFTVSPLVIEETLAPGGTTEVLVNISNPGDGTIDWGASLMLLSDDQKDAWDLQFSFDVDAATGAAGNAGAECDGDNYYSTRWASALIHKYDLDGNMVLEFSVPGVTGLRDLAYDGTYFYGGNAANTIYEMDFATPALVSSIGSPQQVRTIAYDEGDDAFWVSNFGTDITLVSKAGAQLAVIPDAALTGKYGSAYDNWTDGGPYLWVFAQGGGAGTPQYIHQYDLNTLSATGFTFDVLNDLGPNASAIAGGLFTIPNVYAGTVSIGGLLQGTPDTYFMFELAAYSTWISISPTSGTLTGGTDEDMTVFLDATEIVIPGVYEAEIHFSTDPNVGAPVVEVTLTVEGLIPAINLMADYDCTDIMLSWEMPTGGDPDSWNVYRDGTLLDNVDVMEYTDPMMDPEMEYTYTVTAVYGGDESMPTPGTMITVPVPEDLEPVNLEGTSGQGYAYLVWEAPEACLAPDSYSVYKNGEMIADGITELEYDDGPQPAQPDVEYYIVAVYYFGESGASNAIYVDIITNIEDYDASLFQIFPNPASELINVKSPVEITNLRVLNNIGQLVMDEEVNSMEYQINVSQYEAGFYFIKLETSEGTILRKVTVK